MRRGNSRQNTHDRRKDEHQSNHHASEINARDAIKDDENVGVGEFIEAEVKSGGEEKNENLEVEIEGAP